MNETKLQYGEYYHIYNRGNNSEILFKEEKNFNYFLQLYLKYIDSVAETLAYCLMSNHIHFLIKTKCESEIKTFKENNLFQDKNTVKVEGKKPTPSAQFSHLFNTYSKTINDHYNRTGSLFEHPFERRIIENTSYLQHCIAYIHYNPIKAKLVRELEDYKWSSYKALISDKPTHLSRSLVMDIFGDKEYFLNFHGSDPGNLINNLAAELTRY